MPTLSASQIAGYAKNAGLSGQNVSIATAIALAESSGNTEITHTNSNGSTDYGLWQINSVHSDLLNGADWRDPAQNAKMMISISNNGTNWKPWSTFTSGAYLAHLSAANAAVPDTSVGPATGGVQTAGFNTVGDFTASLTTIQQFAQAISDPHNWLRLGMILGGSVMLLVAIHKSVDTHIPAVAKLAAKAAIV
jgi:hypothetical protein